MQWSVAQAKQRLSEVLRRSKEEPQMIYNRDRLAAVVIDPEEYSRYAAWREESDRPSLAQGAARVRALMEAERYELPPSAREDRPNDLAEALDVLPR